MMIQFLKLVELYDFAVWTLILSSVPSILMSGAQLFIYTRYGKGKYVSKAYQINEKLEMYYLNVYFLIYMYSLIGLFICTIFVGITHILIYFRERNTAEAIERFVKQVPYDESMLDKDCSICLASFVPEDNDLVKIRCNHVFHRGCLIQWIKINHTCPYDR